MKVHDCSCYRKLNSGSFVDGCKQLRLNRFEWDVKGYDGEFVPDLLVLSSLSLFLLLLLGFSHFHGLSNLVSHVIPGSFLHFITITFMASHFHVFQWFNSDYVCSLYVYATAIFSILCSLFSFMCIFLSFIVHPVTHSWCFQKFIPHELCTSTFLPSFLLHTLNAAYYENNFVSLCILQVHKMSCTFQGMCLYECELRKTIKTPL
jgi:hypothetical protein